MDKKKIYSVVIFLFVALVLVNSVILIGANGAFENKNIKSILKNTEIENYIEVSADEIPQEDLDEDFLYNPDRVDDTCDNVVD